MIKKQLDPWPDREYSGGSCRTSSRNSKARLGLGQRGSLAWGKESAGRERELEGRGLGLQGDECYSETLINGRRWG